MIKIINNFSLCIDTLTTYVKESETDEKIVNDLQQLLRSSRWSKQLTVCLIDKFLAN